MDSKCNVSDVIIHLLFTSKLEQGYIIYRYLSCSFLFFKESKVIGQMTQKKKKKGCMGSENNMRSKELRMELKQTIPRLRKKKNLIREIAELLGWVKLSVWYIL